MERVNENERFVVKNGIKWIYIYVTMIDQVVLSCLNRNWNVDKKKNGAKNPFLK
jgi:hypothetical protein